MAEREELLNQEREERKQDAAKLKEVELEMEAKHEELESYGSERDTTDQRKMELERELEESKQHVLQIRLDTEAREAELQRKLETIEMKTKEQENAMETERKVNIAFFHLYTNLLYNCT